MMADGRMIIALDMEWNQPLPWKEYRKVPKALMPGEIIQIGAVKLDASGNEISTLRLSVRPRYFKQVHWKVKKLTHISEEDMLSGLDFPEAAAQLGAWLTETGDDFDIYAWGGEDERVLVANLEAWNMNPPWLPDTIYDLRFIYDSFRNKTETSTSLTDAAEAVGMELDLEQHDSLNDARYLAAICRNTDLTRGRAEYEELGPAPAGMPYQRLRLGGFAESGDLQKNGEFRGHTCPACGKELRVSLWVPQNKDRLIGLTKCPCGEATLCRIHFKPRPDGTQSAVRTVYMADAAAKEFYKKKLTRYESGLKHTKKQKPQTETV